MPYGYLGQNTPNQTVSNSGVFSISDVADLEKQGKFGGSLELIEEQTYSSAVSFVDFTSIQENKYDVHYMTFNNVDFVSEQVPTLRFYESGVLETASVYQWAHQACGSNGSFNENKSTSDTLIYIGNFAVGPINAYCYLYNLGNSSKYSFTTHHSIDDDQDTSPSSISTFGGGVLPQASLVDGIRFTGHLGANLSSFTVKLYGVKQL
jgi:hypothetical protein